MNPYRWGIAALLFLATVINYVDRQTLSVVAPLLTRELGISNTEYSNILTAFLIPYTLMYVPSGWLCDRFGTRRAMSAFIVWWSAANILHGFARGAVGLSVFRFLLGAGEAGNFMAAGKATSEWFPAKERAFVNGLVNAAAATGAVVSPPLIAWVTLRFGWRFAFMITGLLGFVWLVAWLWFYRYAGGGPVAAASAAATRTPVPYAELLRMPAVWGLLVSRVFADPVWWFYLFWLPKYLSDVRHFSMAEIGLFAWMPYLAADLGSLSGGWLSGQLVARGRTPVHARVLTMVPFALIMPVGVAVNYLPSTGALALICVVTFSHMAWKTNLMTMTNDIFPASIVGSAAGLVGLGSGLAGAISTPLVGRIVDAFGYQGVFWVMGFLHPVAMLIVARLVRGSAAVSNLPAQPD